MTTRTMARLFDEYSDAAAAVQALEAAGFPRADISVVANRDKAHGVIVAGAQAGGEIGNDHAPDAAEVHRGKETGATLGKAHGVIVAGEQADGEIGNDHVPDAAQTQPEVATGATIGTVVGGGAGLAAGLGALAIPGLGPIVAAGWLLATLTGAGVGAAAGSVIGALTGAGIRETESHVYAEGVRRGGTLVTLRADENRTAAAELIFQRYHAVVPEERGEAYRSAGWKGYDEHAWAAENENPPGTMMSRGLDELAGTNVSGAHPENDQTPARRSGT